jgi:Xaa-Pro dipeptidase
VARLDSRDQQGKAGDIMPANTDRPVEYAAKLDRLRGLLKDRGYAAAALHARRNFAWLTAGGDNHVPQASEDGFATLLVTATDAVVLTAVNEAPRIRDEELNGLSLEVKALPWEQPAAVADEIRALAGGRVASDDDLEGDLWPMRATLMAAEQERYRWLGERTARAVTAVLAATRAGETEMIVGERLALALAADGILAPVLLVASDERILRYRHPIPKPKAIGTSVMLIACAEKGGLMVAITRFAWLGARPDAETMRRFEAVNQVHVAMRAATRPGRMLSEVFADSIAAYEATGYGEEWRLHHQGGPIGYQGREAIATPTNQARVLDGMAFAWNPSITGTKAEDTFIVRSDGSHEIITRDPYWPSGPDGEPGVWVSAW